MGELAALTSSLCWAAASLLFARLGRGLGPLAMNLAKCALAYALLTGTLVLLRGEAWPALEAAPLGWLVASGLVGLTVGDSLYFGALTRLGPRRTLVLSALAPPITAVLALPALGEAITPSMILGMLLTMGGVLWVIRERLPAPEGATEETPPTPWLGIAFGVGAAACQALGNVLTKLGGDGLEALPVAVVRVAAGTAGLLVVVAARGRLRESARAFAEPRAAGLLVLATLIGTYLGIWLQVAGLTQAKVGVAATLSSTAPIFVLPLGLVFLKERPSLRAVLGAVVAVGGIAVLFLS